MNWKLSPTRPADEQPPVNKLLAVCDDAGAVGVGYFTGSSWYVAFINSRITHWADRDELPKPDCYKLPPGSVPTSSTPPGRESRDGGNPKSKLQTPK